VSAVAANQNESAPFAQVGRPLPRWRAASLALLAIGAFGAGVLLYQLASPQVPIVDLELAGDLSRAKQVLGDRQADFVSAVHADWLLIFGYVLALVAAGWLGRRVAWTQASRMAAKLAIAAGIGAGLADSVENGLLYFALDRSGDAWWRAVQTAAYVKFGLLAYAAPVALVALAYAIGRLLPTRRVKLVDQVLAPPPLEPPKGGPLADGPGADRASTAARWERAGKLPQSREPAEVGFCVSGGGIRSACVALGALQELRAARELQRARYLVSVSGGGYLTGALQLALQPRPGRADTPVADPNAARVDDVLAPGSVEEDHLRRHSRYIADTGREWAAALAVLLRGLLLSLTLILLTVAVVGFALAAYYRRVPVSTTVDSLRPQFAQRGSLPFPELAPGLLTALGVTVGLALAGHLLAAALPGLPPPTVPAATQTRAARVCRQLAATATLAAKGLLGVSVLLGLLGVAVPTLVWVDAKIMGALADHGWIVSTPAGGAASTVVLAYLTTLLGLAWRSRSTISRETGRLRRLLPGKGGPPAARALPRGVTQQVSLWLTLAVVLAVLLLLLGWVVGSADRWPQWLPIVVWVAFGVALLFLDQTWLSLHPFYRRRLASAFAVRRATNAAGQVVAAPYSFDQEPTALSKYAARPATKDFPQVIFAAAANLSGCDRTPPGRRAVSFTFSHDWIGGPDVGWIPTTAAEEAAKGQLGRDLTVQAAMAISGAAFASAMGRQARAYQTFFALSNARLGAWLPNPAFLHLQAQAGQDWRVPQLPRLRRLQYLLREITGSFPVDDRLLFCSDGGHYENLGLVELLRHRCRLVYCIDASGDSPPFATTLAEAITLAREELGVEIDLTDPRALVPGSATALDPADPLSALNARLCKAGVIVGRITYPADVSYPNGKKCRYGALVLAKASLPSELPYELLSYAVSNPVFPRDSTSDQWFDHGQFDAYRALGSYIGQSAAELGPAAEREVHAECCGGEEPDEPVG
jgi:hypothetical protein